MPTFADLITPMTSDQIRARTLDLLGAVGFQPTAWQPGSWPLHLIDAWSDVAEEAWFSVAQLGAGLMLETSSGNWLRAIGWNHYREVIPAPTLTQGRIVLTDTGAGPYTIISGANLFATALGVTFRVTGLPFGGTLPVNGTLEVDVTAVKVGASSNVPNDSINTIVSPALPGVVVSNPAIGLTGTWITSLGTDSMSEASFKALCAAKWQTLATGSPEGAYRYWALTTSGVSRAKPDVMNPGGYGTVWVYIDNALSIGALQTTLQRKMPAGTIATAKAATAQNVTIPATVTVRSSYRAAAEAQITANLIALANETDIGGTLIKSELVERIMSPAGVVDVSISGAWAGSPNLTLGLSNYPQFTLALTWIEVP